MTCIASKAINGDKSRGIVEFLINGCKSFLIGAKIGSVRKIRNLIALRFGDINHDKIIRAIIIKEYA